MIELKDISKSFGRDKIIKNVSLEFKEGEFYTILGRSGCGKSTLLRIMNGLETHDQGAVIIDGDILRKENELELRKKIGMVFQSYQLFSHMNLIQNIIMPLKVVKNLSILEAEEIASDFLNKVGLQDHKKKYPHQLSGGQKQRGAIARALSLKPKYMLYDEPTSALDPELALEVQQVMKKIDHSMTQIIVTHDLKFAREISDTIIFMHQGLVVETGTPLEIFSSPKSEATKEFLRNFL